ncbi:AAA domain-containing protein [Neomoorella thermoacetica]|uniref:AAA domain-containing protein n=1 Tax=Neomoorella thermoacetica TaxID=1525 RepID=UPI0030CD030A
MKSGKSENNYGQQQQEATIGEEDIILRVRRPEITTAPKPPEIIRGWLERGWDDPFQEVLVKDTLNQTDSKGEIVALHFTEDQQRVEAFQAWKKERDEWAINERPARAAMKVFEQLYSLYGKIERESERFELVLGDGILNWRLPSGGVHHPVLLQRVQLQFDSRVPEFTVIEADAGVELYTAVLRLAHEVEPGTLAKVRQELEEGGYHPLGGDDTTGFLRRLVQTLSPRGHFEPQGVPARESNDPVIGRSPVLFLRERILGFASAIEAILEDIAGGGSVPGFLLNVVGVEVDGEKDESHLGIQNAVTDNSRIVAEDPADILFSKPWNKEQVQIAARLERSGAVVVQGPPGTGKTHTIANLIGHLLATGKSVLVTAHTTKALRVLRQQVVEPLRPLCVSVLDSDLESRKQLEDSVNYIVERFSRFNAEQLLQEAQHLQQERRHILDRLRKLRKTLLEARSVEYREITISGQTFTPAEAARKVAKERGKHGWLPGPVERNAPLPLSAGELIDLYASNATVTSSDEQELGYPLPHPDDLQKPEAFKRMVDERRDLGHIDRGYRSDLWEEGATINVEELERASTALRDAVNPVRDVESWKLAVLWAGFKGVGHREIWEQLLEKIRTAEIRAAEAAEALSRYNLQLPGNLPLEDQTRIVKEILEATHEKDRLGWFAVIRHTSWRRFIQAARIGDHTPCTDEEFQALHKVIKLELARKELRMRWWQLVENAGGPGVDQLGTQPEHAAVQFTQAIRHCLDWAAKQLEPAINLLKSCGFRWEVFLGGEPPDLRPYGELLRLIHAIAETLPPILVARIAAARWLYIKTEVDTLTRKLDDAVMAAPSIKVVQQLRHAVEVGDYAGYRLAYQRLVQLHGLRQALYQRNELLTRLEKVAPTWANAIRERRGPHGRTEMPGDPEAAWLWCQLEQELDRRASLSIQELQDEITRLTETLYDVTARLVERLAWAAQIRRTTRGQQQALVGWLNIVRRIGKGYGKRVPRLRIEAAKAMIQARTAIPVWIMPLTRVVEYFDPRSTKFDVVIIDEASQSDITALAALYLGKRVIVVGDNEQVSPEAVGEQVEKIEPLIDEYLQGIPNAGLYDGRRSIYDIAWESFGGGMVLLEHFRCVPEIIQFSNALSYNGRIKPLREAGHGNLKPGVVPYKVQGTAVGKVNREEAITVASLLVAASRLPEYRGKTFGAISLVGEEQALEIDRLLRQYMTPDEHRRCQVLCGTSAQFQGDERDVIFLSMVDSPGNGPLALRQDDRFRQRFNVAASRARDQMWLVYSLDPQVDLKPGDLRRRLIEYVRDPGAIMRVLEREEQRVQSEFEKEVMRRLVTRGYRVRAQWPVGYYRIDLVVEGNGRRLAIECDGDRYHPLEKLEEDMARQAILERLGWRFVRIRGSRFFRNPEGAMQIVFDRLKQMDIPPEGGDTLKEDPKLRTEMISDSLVLSAPPGTAPELTPLVKKVIRLAAELRKEWVEEEDDHQGTNKNW